jgi:hypothetical protein
MSNFLPCTVAYAAVDQLGFVSKADHSSNPLASKPTTATLIDQYYKKRAAFPVNEEHENLAARAFDEIAGEYYQQVIDLNLCGEGVFSTNPDDALFSEIKDDMVGNRRWRWGNGTSQYIRAGIEAWRKKKAWAEMPTDEQYGIAIIPHLWKRRGQAINYFEKYKSLISKDMSIKKIGTDTRSKITELTVFAIKYKKAGSLGGFHLLCQDNLGEPLVLIAEYFNDPELATLAMKTSMEPIKVRAELEYAGRLAQVHAWRTSWMEMIKKENTW